MTDAETRSKGSSGGAQSPEPSRHQARLGRYARDYAVVAALVIMYFAFAAAQPETFFSFRAIRTILSSQAALMIATLGLTLTLVVNEFDLTIGATLVLVDTFIAVLTYKLGVPLGYALVLALSVGALVGVINSLLVVKLRINSFIATLGVSTLLTGVALWSAGSTIVASVPKPIQLMAGYRVLGLPLAVYYVFVLAIILWYVLEYTPIGRYMYFTGYNEEVARLSGIRTAWVKAGAFIAGGFIIGFAGLLQAGTVGSADPSAGPSFMLPAFAAAFLGATTIKSGKFNAWGTVVASYLLITGIVSLSMLGMTGYVEYLFNGAALVIAVTAARLATRSQERRVQG